MIHPLIRKELREHLWVLILMWVICLLAVFILLLAARNDGSPLVAYQRLVSIFGVMMSLALANRFVVREYGGRTQLFLETLPMSRAVVIAVKWLTSAACLLVPLAAGFVIILLMAADNVELTSRFVQIMVLRSAVFLLFFHALAFVIGLTGRYRYLLWLTLLLLVMIADTQGQLPAEQWPPMQLVARSLAFEREIMPVSSLWITGGAAAVLMGAAFALALGFQGSWVIAMSRRMSLREKVIAAAVLLSVGFVVDQIDDRKRKAPFALQDAIRSPEGAPMVGIARASYIDDAAASQLAMHMAADLADLRQYLGLTKLPSVAVLPDSAVDADQFLLAKLPTSDGVVVRAAIGSQRFDEPDFRAYSLAHVIDWHSQGRAEREEQRWLLDGFSSWRVAQQDNERRDLLALRAAVAADAIERRDGSMLQALQHWFVTREELGECLADALAWRATEQLSQSMGDERFRKFARSMLGVRSRSGLHAYLTDLSLDEQLKDSGLSSMAAFADQLAGALGADRNRLADRITGVQRWPVRFEAMPMRGSTYELRYEVSAPTATQFAVRYARLGPWDGEVSRADLERVDATTSGVLPASFARGTRLLVAMEVQDPVLGCAVRLGSRRLEIQ